MSYTADATPQVPAPDRPRAATRRARLGADPVLRHSLIYFVGRALPAVLMVASVPVFVRALGAESYGLYALYAGVALLAGNTAGASVAQPVLRFGARFRDSAPTLYRATIRLGRRRALVLAAVATALGVTLLPHDLWSAVTAVVLAGSTTAYGIAFSQRQAALEALRATLLDVLRVILTVGVPAVAVFGFGRTEPAWLLAGAAIGNAAAAIELRRMPASGNPWRERVLDRRFLAFGAPIAAWMLVSTLLNISDRYLIEWLIGTEAVGAYSAVYDVVSKGIVFASTPMLMAAHPLIMDAWNRGKKGEARGVLRSTTLFAGIVGSAVTAIVWVASPFVVGVVLGAEAPEGVAGLVGPVAAGAFLWQIAMLVHKPLELAERTGAMLAAASAALVLNILLNVAFLPQFGVLAAAYATTAGGVLYLGAVGVAGQIGARP